MMIAKHQSDSYSVDNHKWVAPHFRLMNWMRLFVAGYWLGDFPLEQCPGCEIFRWMSAGGIGKAIAIFLLAQIVLIALPAQEDTSPEEVLVESWKAGDVVELQADLHHVQGIDVEGGTLWVSSVDRKAGKGFLSKFELSTGRLLARVEVQEGARIHPGGISLDGASIWIPVAEYDRDGPTTMQQRDKHTLALVASFVVPDHIGCVAVRGDLLAGGSWSSRTVYTWRRDGTQIGRVRNPNRTAWQEIKFDGDMLIGSGDVSPGKGLIEWVKYPTLEPVRRVLAGQTDRGQTFTHEGMAWRAGRLYLLPEDAPSRLFQFEKK